MNQNKADEHSGAIHKLIAERAYELWENRGRPDGYDLLHWREAEQDIISCLERVAAKKPFAPDA